MDAIADVITAKELSIIKGVSERYIRILAKKENWPYKKGPGGIKQFIVSQLPDTIRSGISQIATSTKNLVNPVDLKKVNEIQSSTVIPDKERLNNGTAKADLVRIYTQCMNQAGHGRKMKARTEFMRAYHSGFFPGLYERLGHISWQTVERWKRTLEDTGETFDLCDGRGAAQKNRCSLTREQSQILLRCALHPNKPLVSEAIRRSWSIMHAKGIPNGNSERTYRRWLKDWISKNHHIWTFTREGAQAWNDKCAMYIERDYSMISVGDILVADGHTLNFEIINPWTGKPKRMILILWYDMKSNFPLGWEIMPTENTQAISAALGRAIIRLGKYPKVAYLDNGKAFRARFFKNTDFAENGFDGLYRRLGIKTIFAWPYHGQSKTVERFFGTFAEMERMMPTYTGTSIEKQPPRMRRGEKLHGRVYDKIMGDRCLTMEQAHYLVAAWFDEYAGRSQQGHLEGRTPVDVFLEEKGPGVDKGELIYLMMSKKIRTIHRNGIRFMGPNYYDPALYGRRHPVIIRYDLQDLSEIYVFGPDGEYICAARPKEKMHPAANTLGDTEDQKRLKAHIEMKRHQEKEASILAREFLESEVLPAHRRFLETTTRNADPVPETEKIRRLPAPSAKEAALKKEVDVILIKQSEDKAREKQEMDRRIEEGMRQYHESLGKTVNRKDAHPETDIPRETILDDDPNIWNVLPEMAEKDRYEKLAEFEVRGWAIPKEWQAFMSYFEQTPEYRNNQDYYDEHRGRIAQMYQIYNTTEDIYD